MLKLALLLIGTIFALLMILLTYCLVMTMSDKTAYKKEILKRQQNEKTNYISNPCIDFDKLHNSKEVQHEVSS